jgi:hypothetical protein
MCFLPFGVCRLLALLALLTALLEALASLVLGDLVAVASLVAASCLHPAEVRGCAAKVARLPVSRPHGAHVLLASSRGSASETLQATDDLDLVGSP